MIFVTVGTHEQPFDRLIKYIDTFKKNEKTNEEIIIQTGYSTYEPENCTWKKLYPYQQMLELVNEARIVITHGGPSSFIMPLQIGKTPIVIPRQYEYHEHVNNHQVTFCKAVADKMGTIIVVEELELLGHVIENYDKIIKNMGEKLSSNNANFNKQLEDIVDKMFKGKK